MISAEALAMGLGGIVIGAVIKTYLEFRLRTKIERDAARAEKREAKRVKAVKKQRKRLKRVIGADRELLEADRGQTAIRPSTDS